MSHSFEVALIRDLLSFIEMPSVAKKRSKSLFLSVVLLKVFGLTSLPVALKPSMITILEGFQPSFIVQASSTSSNYSTDTFDLPTTWNYCTAITLLIAPYSKQEVVLPHLVSRPLLDVCLQIQLVWYWHQWIKNSFYIDSHFHLFLSHLTLILVPRFTSFTS